MAGSQAGRAAALRARLRRATALLSLVLAALACAHGSLLGDAPPVTQPLVERTGQETLRIGWPESFASGPVAIFAGPRPDAIDHGAAVANAIGSATLSARETPLAAAGNGRAFFELVPWDGTPPAIVAERRLNLEGAVNFRDLGGYRTRDGRQVRWGRLFRSDDLAELSRSDVVALSRLGIRLVCDFRTLDVQREEPDRSIESGATEALALPIEQVGVEPSAMRTAIRTGGIAALQIEQLMLRSYESFVTEEQAAWSAMFARLADPASLPALVHCTAGKDRTGFASALVLLALGVPEATVFEDYLLTNYYQRDFLAFVLRWTPLYSFFRTDPEDLRPLLEARPEYLQRSLDTIAARYGTLDAYLSEGLGITPEERRALETNLLVP